MVIHKSYNRSGCSNSVKSSACLSLSLLCGAICDGIAITWYACRFNQRPSYFSCSESSDIFIWLIMTPAPIRIALLTCDTPIDTVRDVHGDYKTIFSTLLTRSLPSDAGKDRYVLDNYDVVSKMAYPVDVDAYDALLITGSGEDVTSLTG